MKFALKFGHKKIIVKINKKNFLGVVLLQKKIKHLGNFLEKAKKSLKKPDFGRALAKKIQPGKTTAIVISDRTREVQTNEWLPVLLDELNAIGVPDKKIFCLFALGTHPKQSRGEQIQIIGRAAARRIKFFDHHCRDQKNLVKIGVTSRGTPVEINKKYLEAPNKILTGLITYHYFAGFTGGRKSVLPGLGSFRSITANHSILYNSKLNFHALCQTGILEGNPLSEDMTEAALMTRPTFLINFIFEEKKPLAIFSGDFQAAHELGCRFFDRLYRVLIRKKADLVVASAGGFPKDLDFVQVHKAVDNAVRALKPGGVLIFLAEGKKTFPNKKYLQAFGLEESVLEKKLCQKYCVPTQTCRAFLEKARNFKIIWVSTYFKKYAKLMKMTGATNFSRAWQLAQKFLPKNFKTYVIPEAALTMPVEEK